MCVLSLKLECDKLASEKSEMQRHYVMVKPPLGLGVGVGRRPQTPHILQMPATESSTG